MELRWFFAVIRRWAWLIVGCTLLALVIAFGVTARMPPTYGATTTLLVMPAEQMSTSEYNTLMAGQLLALTYGQMLEEQSILQTAISRLGLEETPETLAKKIKTEPVNDTQLVRVTARDSSPARAALVANTIADIFIDYTKALEEDRYRDDILGKETKIEAQRKLVEETQSQIDALGTAKVADETELPRLQVLLADYRNTNRTLQQDLQSLQPLVEGIQDQVKIVETARVPTAGAWVPETKTMRPSRVPTAEVSIPSYMRTQTPRVPTAEARVLYRVLYKATVTLLVDQGEVNQGTDYSGISGILASERLVGTYAQMVVGPSVLEAAIASLGTGQSPDALAATVKAEPIAGTQLVKLQVTGTDAWQTARQANAIAQAFVDQIQEMLRKPYAGRLATMQAEITRLSALIDDTQAEVLARTAVKLRNESELARLQGVLAEYLADYRVLRQDYEQLRLAATQASGTVVITERAHEPQEPVRNRVQYVLLAALVAVLVALGMAFLIEYLNESIRTPEDVSHVLGLSTIGMIEQFGRGKEELIVASQPQSPATEAFRVLAANIRLSSMDSHPRTILVTSPASSEGKSVVAANLAVAMASVGLRVVVVDADLRLPRLHQLFGVSRGHGLTDALWQGSTNGHLKPTAVKGLEILTSGTLPPDPVVVLSSPHMKQLLTDLTKEADLVIIDSPPVLPVADTTILAAGVDGVLLLLRAGHARSQPTRHAVEVLRQTRTHLIGVVLNAVPVRRDEYYRYYGTRGETAVGHSRLRKALGSFPWSQPHESGQR